jgi:hypothetical protein
MYAVTERGGYSFFAFFERVKVSSEIVVVFEIDGAERFARLVVRMRYSIRGEPAPDTFLST